MKILGNSRARAAWLSVAVGAVVGLGCLAGAPHPAFAQAEPAAAAPKPANPKALFTSGEKKYKSGDYAPALEDFEAANTAKSTPETLRYIALCHDKLDHFTEAVAAYEKFLADVPAKMSAEGEEAKKRVEAIKAMPGKVKVETVPPNATVVVDGQTPAPTQTPTLIELAPGKHSLQIRAEGYEETTRDVDVTFATTSTLSLELTPAAAAPATPPPVTAEPPPTPAAPPPPPPVEPRSKVPAYVTGAVAIVAAGVGTGFGIKALSQSSDFDKNPTTKLADDGENNALVADMMFGIAITFGVTSAVLFLSSDAPQTAKAPSRPAPSKVTFTAAPYVNAHGGGAGAQVRF